MHVAFKDLSVTLNTAAPRPNPETVVVSGATDSAAAWDAAESFLSTFGEDDETTDYSTGMPGDDGRESLANGTYEFRVKTHPKQ